MRITRLKSHQLGIDIHDLDAENANESGVIQEKLGMDESKDLILENNETNNQTTYLQNYSVSEDENLSNLSEFANSRTIIKP